jgi:hypothetical protein
MQRSYRTPKGTDLPILNLRGKEYLEVKYRLVWFREDHPDWAIETELLSVSEESAYARATIKDSQGRVIATSHKFESKIGFSDFIEKAETGAIGRALALIGYGTQFCADELDEGERIVDSPVAAHESRVQAEEHAAVPMAPQDPGEYRISFGRRYKGLKLCDIPRGELEGYIEWLEDSASKKGIPLSEEARSLKVAVGRYLHWQNESHEGASSAQKQVPPLARAPSSLREKH